MVLSTTKTPITIKFPLDTIDYGQLQFGCFFIHATVYKADTMSVVV